MYTPTYRSRYTALLVISCMLILMGSAEMHGQLLEVQLAPENTCDGKIHVDILLSASNLSTQNFKIGSSSFYLEYDTSVVSFDGYAPALFDSIASDQSAASGWISQAASYDSLLGALHIVAHKEGVDHPENFLMTKSQTHLLGRATWSFRGPEIDPMIKLSSTLTQCNNALSNDGQGSIPLQEFPKVLTYSCPAQCTVEPTIDSIRAAASSCEGIDGTMTLYFDDTPGESDIAISIDGGVTYPYVVADNQDSLVIQQLSTGFYDVWVRWGDERCPSPVEDLVIGVTDGPALSSSSHPACGADEDGAIILDVEPHAMFDTMEISTDGGISYGQYAVVSEGPYTLDSLAAGSYDLWVQWRAFACPVDIGIVDVESAELPDVTWVETNPCGDLALGGLVIYSLPGATADSIEVSLDGGIAYDYRFAVADSFLVIRHLDTGSYELVTSSGACELYHGVIDIEQEIAPVISITSHASCAGGSTGDITMIIHDHAQYDSAQLSLDGGMSYTTYPDDAMIVIDDLASGSYPLISRWPDGSCVSSDSIQVDSIALPSLSIDLTPSMCSDNEGVIAISWTDHAGQDSLYLSIDGGSSWASVLDAAESYSYTALSAGMYVLVAAWDDMGGCQSISDTLDLIQSSVFPQASGSPISTACGDQNGAILISITDEPMYDSIAISIDDAVSYEHYGDVDTTLLIDDLSPGQYQLWARWTDGECPIYLGPVTVDSSYAPSAVAVAHDAQCLVGDSSSLDWSSGMIQISSAPDGDHPVVEYSLDSGLTWTWSASSSETSTDLTGLVPGHYELWSRWGDGSCETYIGGYDIGLTGGPTMSLMTSPDCDETATGSIVLFPVDDPSWSVIRISVDGGASYPYMTSDQVYEYTISGLAAGAYDVWASYDGGNCPVPVDVITVDSSFTPDVVVSTVDHECFDLSGYISFSLPETGPTDSVDISLDGGLTYTVRAALHTTIQIDSLPAGTYPVVAQWSDGTCGIDLGHHTIDIIDAPEAIRSAVPTTCGLTDGSITVEITDGQLRDSVQLSIDGGASFPYLLTDGMTAMTIDSLSTGTYEPVLRWKDASCTTVLDSVEIYDLQSPDVSAVAQMSTCSSDPADPDRLDLSNGQIDLTLVDEPSQTHVEVSIDGGVTYPYIVADSVGVYIIDDLTPGVYRVWSRWSGGLCEDYVGMVIITVVNGPVASLSYTDECDGGAPGSVTIYPQDHAEFSQMELSIDGGVSYPFSFSDDVDSVIIDSLYAGDYELWLRFSGGACPVALDQISIEMTECGPPLTCYDGILNGDEEYIDCGGSCTPCDECPYDTIVVDASLVLLDLELSASGHIRLLNRLTDSTSAHFTAPDSLVLSAGFEVPLGATLELEIGECDPIE